MCNALQCQGEQNYSSFIFFINFHSYFFFSFFVFNSVQFQLVSRVGLLVSAYFLLVSVLVLPCCSL